MKTLITQDFVDRLAPGEPTTFRDTKLAGFLVVVNRKSISFAVQRDLWRNRQLVKTCRVKLGRVGTMTVKTARAEAGRVLALIASGVDPNEPARAEPTLADAFASYLVTLDKRGRAEKTIAMYRYSFDAYLSSLHKKTCLDIGSRPAEVARLHDRLTRKHGPYSANRSMSLLRAVYRHARRVDARLPEDPVGRAVTFNREKRRNYGMTADQIAEWWARVEALPNPARRAFHKVSLLTGARPGSVAALRWADIDFERSIIQFEKAKGHPYAVPMNSLTHEALENLPRLSGGWVFAAASRAGHIVEWKEPKHPGLYTGHSLRHCYRGILAQLGVDGLTGRLLMGHVVGGDVHDGYLDATVMAGSLARASEKVAGWVRAATATLGATRATLDSR